MTTNQIRPVTALSVADLERYPVWEFAHEAEGEGDETGVRPVNQLPVLRLAHYRMLWAPQAARPRQGEQALGPRV